MASALSIVAREIILRNTREGGPMEISRTTGQSVVVIALFVGVCARSYAAVDGSGWTVFAKSPDTRVIYVSSSSGNDGNSGLAESLAVRTISRAASLLRTGYPDWLLFKKGDTWDQGLGLRLSGRSATEPMLISSYGAGTRRPQFKTGASGGVLVTGGGGAPSSVNHVAYAGLHFYANARDPSSPDYNASSDAPGGFTWLLPGTDLLVEDCVFQFYSDNMNTQGYRNLRLRRDQLLDSYNAGGAHSQGIYADDIDTLLIEECIFDHNGWNETISGAEATIFNHNMYIQTNCKNVTIRRTISLRASSHGLQLRPGGMAEDNLFVRNPLSLLIGAETSVSHDTAQFNVILEGTDINNDHSNFPRGFGISINSTNALIKKNVVAHLGAATSTVNAQGIENKAGSSYESNIEYDWGRTDTFTTPGPFPDPSRSVATYNARCSGPGTFEDFAAELRLQSRDRWRSEYTANAVNNYIREGFGMTSVAGVKNPAGQHAARSGFLALRTLDFPQRPGMPFLYDLLGHRLATGRYTRSAVPAGIFLIRSPKRQAICHHRLL
jgi:hypothetical protein